MVKQALTRWPTVKCVTMKPLHMKKTIFMSLVKRSYTTTRHRPRYSRRTWYMVMPPYRSGSLTLMVLVTALPSSSFTVSVE